MIILDFRTLVEIPAREVFEHAPWSATWYVPLYWALIRSVSDDPCFPNSGSVPIGDIEYRWKAKGVGSKVVVRQRHSPPLSKNSTPPSS